MEKAIYGKTAEGQEATLYTIANTRGIRAQILDFGATIVRLYVPDKDGNAQDIILGYDDVATYQRQKGYFGAIVGRNCNRISDAKIVIDGVEYALEPNDRGNNLHSGSNGISSRFWNVKNYEENKITFVIEDAHLTQGFPGNAVIEVTYEVTEDNELSISYYARTDQKTVFNFTNHAYFNLNGHSSGDVLEQTLQIKASHYTPVKDEKSIPTGEILPVEGTPFDFREEKTIGRDVHADMDQIHWASGYDHNFALDRSGAGMELVATAYGPKTGIRMDVITDSIAMQLYTANTCGGEAGKDGVTYPDYAAMCLETQYFPNAINEPNFVSPLTDVDAPYESKTVYKFTVTS